MHFIHNTYGQYIWTIKVCVILYMKCTTGTFGIPTGGRKLWRLLGIIHPKNYARCLWIVFVWFGLVLGPISLTNFPSRFKFDDNFIYLQFDCWWLYRHKILHMSRQHSCRAMYKMLQRSFNCNLDESKMKCPSHLTCQSVDCFPIPWWRH